MELRWRIQKMHTEFSEENFTVSGILLRENGGLLNGSCETASGWNWHRIVSSCLP
jgi:hypothetical protein